MTVIQWTEKTVKLSELKPYERNPRSINKDAYKRLLDSIKRLGYHQRIICQPDGTVIGGHQRLKALNELKIKEVVVLIPSRELSPEEYRELLIRDNVAYGEWDFDILSSDFDVSDLNAWGVDLPIIKVDQEVIEDEAPEAPANPVSRLGDVWILGNHRVICGDSTMIDNVNKLLDGVKPNLMVTDPPYGVEYDPNWRNEADRSNGKKLGARAIGAVSNDDKADWREAWALFPGNIAYVWHAGLYAAVVAESLTAASFKIRSQIIWAKSNFAIGRGDYHWQHEPCWYAVRQTGDWHGDRKQTTLWQIPKPQKSETGHSTQKPVECMLRPILNNSSPGQAVYDPFLGSGTTLIAAEQSGRTCYGIELNPAYVDVIVTRWMNLTGQQAYHADTGEVFVPRETSAIDK